MRFGLQLGGLAQHLEGEDMEVRMTELLEWVHTARDVGYDALTKGEHYLTSPYQMLQSAPLLGRLIPETGDMKLVSTIIAPLHNPVELAATWATLDIMSGGRIVLSMALGYRDVEYRAFGVDPAKRVQAQLDNIRTLRALWTQNSVTAEGRNFSLIDDHSAIRPVQKPHPPIWIAANADAAIRRAARLGLDWNINGHATFATIERQVALYKEAATGAGQRGPFRFSMSRELYCAPTTEKAFQIAGPYVAAKYKSYNDWGQQKALPGEERFDIALKELAQGRFTLGDPDVCAQQLRGFQELGVDWVNMRMIWPGMPLEQAKKSMVLFAEEVIPRLRDQAPTSTAATR